LYLLGNLAAAFPGNALALGLGNLASGVNALGPWNAAAPGDRDGPWGLDWNLVADLVPM